MAATTTSRPCARAASRTRKGNFPLPAIKPSRGLAGMRGQFSTQHSVLSIQHSDTPGGRLGDCGKNSGIDVFGEGHALWSYRRTAEGGCPHVIARGLNAECYLITPRSELS